MEILSNEFKKLSLEEKQNLTDQQLIDYFEELREYYLSLPYDESNVKYTEKVYGIVAMIAKAILWLKFNRQLENRELLPVDNGYIYISNHLTYIDQFLMADLMADKNGIRPTHYLASSEFLTMKRGILYRALGPVFVDRKDEQSRANARIEQTKHLLHKRNIAVFPEGTRKPPYNILKPFEIGAAKMAQDTGAGIVPLAINNNYKRNALMARVCSKPIFVSPTDDLIKVTENLWDIVYEGANENGMNYLPSNQKVLRR